ncbi:MAG: hypothetical protein ISR65_07515 [Bacteriovoracaceae bacterium]|nr:hypothetical protein [Bacteriovoracaceae bacterium]
MILIITIKVATLKPYTTKRYSLKLYVLLAGLFILPLRGYCAPNPIELCSKAFKSIAASLPTASKFKNSLKQNPKT